MFFGMTLSGMVSGAYTASLCIVPEFSGIIESMSAFLGDIAYISSSATAGFVVKTVDFLKDCSKKTFFLGFSRRMGRRFYDTGHIDAMFRIFLFVIWIR